MAIVEAKRNDIDGGLGQCVAQMVAAAVYNDRAGQPPAAVYGCVTTGEDWQFLGLSGTAVTLAPPAAVHHRRWLGAGRVRPGGSGGGPAHPDLNANGEWVGRALSRS